MTILGNCNIEGEDDSWDFGTGAGFYVDATEGKWKKHYRMYSYVTKEVCFGSFGKHMSHYVHNGNMAAEEVIMV